MDFMTCFLRPIPLLPVLLPLHCNTASAQTFTTALTDANSALNNAKAAYPAISPPPWETVKKGDIDWMLAESQELINKTILKLYPQSP